MKTNLVPKIVFAIFILIIFSCNKSKNEKSNPISEVQKIEVPTIEDAVFSSTNINDFIPKDFVLFEKITGDLDKNGTLDCVLIIKGTDKNKIIADESRGKLDQNRRGIIVLLNKENGYELAVSNIECFSSENEDGGVYYAPELYIEIKKNNLFIKYLHGRYGWWGYTFRLKNNDFELIGYDSSSNRGPIILSETSINYLTKKRIDKHNTNEESEEPEEEIFEETVSKIETNKLFKLSKINDFDDFSLQNSENE